MIALRHQQYASNLSVEWVLLAPITGPSVGTFMQPGRLHRAVREELQQKECSEGSCACSGDLDSMSERELESTDGGEGGISRLDSQVLKGWDQKSVSHQSGSSDGYPGDASAYTNGKKLI